MDKKRIIIATIKSWNIRNAYKLRKEISDRCRVFIITDKEKLSYARIKEINPVYIFFPHWSWFIPKDIYDNFECVVFHMTDLPYGRGGSPLQNLILNKVYRTKITAIKVEKRVDVGKVYLKKDLYIGSGSAEKIFRKASEIVFFKMMPSILKNHPAPLNQKGAVVYFKRRTPQESDIATSDITTIDDFYDFIRMLDAEDYPKAFLKVKGFKIMFSGVNKKQNKLKGRFEIIDEKQ
jgi:methionyl-tRNA formyltransferase